MEIHMITEFSDGVKLLQTPIASTTGSFFLFGQFQRWWKLGALVLAIYATLVRRSKLVLILYRRFRRSRDRNNVERINSGENDDSDSVADSVEEFSSDDDDERGDKAVVIGIGKGKRNDGTMPFRGGDYDVNGSSRLSYREENRKPEFNLGRNVVQLWDTLGLSLDFDSDSLDLDSRSVVSTWDSDDEQKAIDYWTIPSSPLVLTAEGNGKGDGVILSGYDSRIRRRSPALYAEWNSPTRRVTGVASGGVSKVYVRDDVNGVIGVGDVRKVGRPLRTVKGREGERWWDADAVSFDD